jgi:DNA-binding CsgD family transcriptional regulator
MAMLSPGGRQPGGDVLASWAESLASRRDEMRGRGCLRFAFYGRVSTENWQDPVTSRARQLQQAVMLTAGHGMIVVHFFDAGVSSIIALELWDFESWRALAVRQVQVARDVGALVQLIQAAAQIAAGRGRAVLAFEAAWATAVLDNGLGRYDAARAAARQAFERGQPALGHLVVAELAEAAARTGDTALVQATLDWLSERTRVTPTEWVLGIEARIRALLSDGQTADRCYQESVERLGRTRLRAELARSHLLYGEWLRRQGRRTDAREQLRTAHRMLDTMGMAAFAERARRELRATGETARKRTVPAARIAGATEALTAQEAQVARLARDGLSNPEIGARLFISPRTAAYHLSNVFTKLGIGSRSQLDRVLPAGPDTAGPR